MRLNEPAFSAAAVKPEFEKLLHPSVLRRIYGRYGKPAETIIGNAAADDLKRIPGTDSLWAELPVVAKTERIRHLSDLLAPPRADRPPDAARWQ